jgi:simple sugar transport system permease protein
MSGRLTERILLYVVSVAGALLLSGILVEATGGDWRPVLDALIDGSILGPGRWGQTLAAAAPMLLVALGTIISGRAGLVNIGQEGVLLVFGAIGGAVWAGIAGVLRFKRGVPEVLSTLLLVTVAAQTVAYGLKNQWLLLADEASRGNRNQVSAQLADDNRLPEVHIFGNDIPFAVFLSAAAAVILAFALTRTTWGFRLRMLGRNPRAAQRAGISQDRSGLGAFLLSGAFAGLAGAAMLAGGGFLFGNYRLVPGFSSSIGWTGLLVALVAREKAMAAIPVAIVFGALRTGSGFVGSTGVESRITEVIQGFLVLSLLIPPAVMFVRERRRARALSTART